MRCFILVFFLSITIACSSKDEVPPMQEEEGMEEEEMNPEPADTISFFRGADLSYVNEMEDCGAHFKNLEGEDQDPYQIFAEAGTNLVRIRLWHQPDWTNYSNLEDVKKSIQRAKQQGMKVLLDFHNSDDWADPGKQYIPAAWLPVITDTPTLGDSLYQYVYNTLLALHAENLLPEMVQMGNEINAEILQDPNEDGGNIDWLRNATLINRGLKAIRDASASTGVEIASMLHIAQPENALWWFAEAQQYGVRDYDWIGLSYYPAWSGYSLDQLPQAIESLRTSYGKRVMVVETAYPFQFQNNDNANNILGTEALLEGFEATPQGQLDYLFALEERIEAGGGEGLIYWEPAWVSTTCSTRWGQGSHWDNATLFDNDNRAIIGLTYYNK